MHKRWLYKTIPATDQIATLSKQINVNSYLSAVLLQRGIKDFNDAKSFFRPSLDQLHDPFLMKDMDKAVSRLNLAMAKKEKILIYGDYDVDGTTAVSLVYNYLSRNYPYCEVYIPDRYSEGYGVSQEGIEWASENGYSLIIALDCGIKSSEMVTLAKNKEIDFIICDHHLPGENIPDAVAVLDPKRNDCPYPYKELSGCGIGFKFMQAYARTYDDELEVFNNIDLVAVSIASDIVPITGENRILGFHGLKKLNENPLPGLKALINIAGLKNEIDISSVVFTLGPRINAAGRIAHARGAVELLISQSDEEANVLAEKVNVKNEVRRQVDADITEEAIAMIEGDSALRAAKSTVLFKNTWHKGVIGIVAARCVEKYYRPTVILTESNNKITGSARSIHGFDLYNAILECSDLLEKFGGHKYAAGLTLEMNNLKAFQQKFEKVVSAAVTDEMLTPDIDIDLPLPFDVITTKFLNVLKQMSPFGPENQRPVFMTSNVFVFNSLTSFKDKHVKFLVSQEGSDSVFNAVGFDLAANYERLAQRDLFSMAYTIEENNFNGSSSIQLRIKDIKFN